MDFFRILKGWGVFVMPSYLPQDAYFTHISGIDSS